jgi:hypothetical protein
MCSCWDFLYMITVVCLCSKCCSLFFYLIQSVFLASLLILGMFTGVSGWNNPKRFTEVHKYMTGWWFQRLFIFSIIKMGCHPSHWRTHIFQDAHIAPPTMWPFVQSNQTDSLCVPLGDPTYHIPKDFVCVQLYIPHIPLKNHIPHMMTCSSLTCLLMKL